MKSSARLGWVLAVSGSLAGLPQIARAGDDIQTKADVTSQVGYSNNPFGESGSNLGSAYVEIEAVPQAKLATVHGVFTLRGDVRLQHYFRNYSDTTALRGSLDYVGTPTSRLTTHGNIGYTSQVIGGLDFSNSVIDNTQPVPVTQPQPQPSPTTGTDLAFIGTRERQRTLSFNGDVSYVLSSRENLTAYGFYNIDRYGGNLNVANFDGYGGGAGYSRRVTGNLQIGVQASVTRYAYQALGDSQIYTVQGTVTDTLNSQWQVTGALGASYTQRSLGGNSTYPTGTIQICRRTTRVSTCANYSRTVQPTGGGTSASSIAGISYSYRLSERSTIGLTGSYLSANTRVNAILANANIYGVSTYAVTANYDHQLWQRVHLTASTRYRSVSARGRDIPHDFGGMLGISVRFGDLR